MDNRKFGIKTYNEVNITVDNNVIEGNGSRGISCHDQSSAYVKYNLIRDNGMGVNFEQQTKGTVDSNVIMDNILESVRCTDSAVATVKRNTVNSYTK